MANKDYRIYAITAFDPNFGDEYTVAFEKFLKTDPVILGYWNYIPLFWMVKTRTNASQLAARLRPYFANGSFFVGEIDPTNVDGWLPKEAWEWFWLSPPEERPAMAASPRGILGLLADQYKDQKPKP